MNYTNEINQIVQALQSGAQQVTPVAEEFIHQYQTRELFLALSCLTAGIVAWLILFMSVRAIRRLDVSEDLLGLAIIIISLVLGVTGIIVPCHGVAHFANYLAPLPSLLGR